MQVVPLARQRGSHIGTTQTANYLFDYRMFVYINRVLGAYLCDRKQHLLAKLSALSETLVGSSMLVTTFLSIVVLLWPGAFVVGHVQRCATQGGTGRTKSDLGRYLGRYMSENRKPREIIDIPTYVHVVSRPGSMFAIPTT